MYKWLATTKQGFTLVELMIVLVLLALGIAALLNLSNLSYKTFNKTEERYVKQEEVKRVAELLQSASTRISAAVGVEIYDTLDVIPAKGAGMGVKGYSYLYTDPTDGKLYVRESGSDNPYKVSDIPLYIYFEVVKKREGAGGFIYPDNSSDGILTNQCGLRCSINALEEEAESFVYPIDDEYIYYTLEVTYHFPNMIERSSGRVNRSADMRVLSCAKFDQTTGEKTTDDVDTVDVGNVVRFVGDSSVLGDAVTTDISVASWCFIATASYGKESPDVGLLCNFRDSVLRKTEAGRWFVEKYYTYSPPIAEKIADSPALRLVTRTLLKPLVLTAYVALNPEWLVLIVPVAGALVITVIRRKQQLLEDQ